MTNQEAQMTALHDLKEAMVERGKLKKVLAIDTREGVHLNNYRNFQDTYLKLKQMGTDVDSKLKHWKLLLPEDDEGLPIYPAMGEDGFEYAAVKFRPELNSIAKVFKTADVAIADFVVSLGPRKHRPIWNEARIMVLGDRDYTTKLLNPPEGDSDEDSTLVPEPPVVEEAARVPEATNARATNVLGA